MKVYILEFCYFDSAEWNHIEKRITAKSKIQLIRAVIKETTWIHKRGLLYSGKTQEELRRELWNKIKVDINEKDLTFPIVEII